MHFNVLYKCVIVFKVINIICLFFGVNSWVLLFSCTIIKFGFTYVTNFAIHVNNRYIKFTIFLLSRKNLKYLLGCFGANKNRYIKKL